MPNYETILGVNITNLNLEQTHQTVSDYLRSAGQHTIFTSNPEFLVRARKDNAFKDILNAADLNVCDGVGIKLASSGKLTRIPGVDLMFDICKMATQENLGIFLLGGTNGVAKKTAEMLTKEIPNIKISGYDTGPIITESSGHDHLIVEEKANRDLIVKISSSQTKILFVAFGMGKQEKWISENLPKMPSVKVAMGVGGSFDYISGVVDRAPCFMRKIGLEWLYRLVRQPQRFKRIIDATLIFTYLVIKDKLK